MGSHHLNFTMIAVSHQVVSCFIGLNFFKMINKFKTCNYGSTKLFTMGSHHLNFINYLQWEAII